MLSAVEYGASAFIATDTSRNGWFEAGMEWLQIEIGPGPPQSVCSEIYMIALD